MLDHPIFLLSLGVILIFGLGSRLAERSIITAPMVFVTVGIIASFFITEEVRSNVQTPWVKVVAELTLIIVLFIDSSTIDIRHLMKDRQLPIRLLFIGLPVTMVAGILLAIPIFPDMNIWVLALMALILSPTDAALGMAVVTSERVPLRIRQAINVESGLNDGLALPPILVCLAVLSGAEPNVSYWGLFTLKQFVFGPIIGAAVGYLGGYLVERASTRDWMNETYQRLASLPIPVLAYAGAELVHGNGFIAAFFSGLFLGTQTKIFRERIHGFGDSLGQFLVLMIFLLAGAILIPLSYPYWTMAEVLYSLLSLTVIRILPVMISLWGSGLDLKTMAFVGWFGPRGIASILYLLLAVLQIGTEGYRTAYGVISLTVLLSIFLHGVTAVPFSKMFKPESGNHTEKS